MVVLSLPLNKIRHQLLHIAFIADEIVVNDKDCPAPTGGPQSVKFGNHLLIAFSARHATINLYDVAKLAIEWTPSRVLNRHRRITIQLGKFEIGNWSQ